MVVLVFGWMDGWAAASYGPPRLSAAPTCFARVAACKQRDDAEHAARIFKDKMMEEVEKNIVMQRELEKLRESYGVSVNRTMSMQSGKSSGLLACLGFERVQ